MTTQDVRQAPSGQFRSDVPAIITRTAIANSGVVIGTGAAGTVAISTIDLSNQPTGYAKVSGWLEFVNSVAAIASVNIFYRINGANVYGLNPSIVTIAASGSILVPIVFEGALAGLTSNTIEVAANASAGGIQGLYVMLSTITTH